MSKLTKKETATLASIIDSIGGEDFTFFDELEIPECVDGIHGLAAVFGSLQSKGLVEADDQVTVNGRALGTQIWIDDDMLDECLALVKAAEASEALEMNFRAGTLFAGLCPAE